MSATNLLLFELRGKTVSSETYGVPSYSSGWTKDVVRLLGVSILSLARVATSILFVATNMCKHVFVATKPVFCPDKKICLSRQNYVATKTILVAALADSIQVPMTINRPFAICSIGTLILYTFNPFSAKERKSICTCL